jgi:hypothetical protein
MENWSRRIKIYKKFREKFSSFIMFQPPGPMKLKE